MLTLKRRYYCVTFPSPKVAYSFAQHPMHRRVESLRHVRVVRLTVPSLLNSSDIEKYTTAMHSIPGSSLQGLLVQDEMGESRAIAALLASQSGIGKLAVIAPHGSWLRVFNQTEFCCLRKLVLRSSFRALPTKEFYQLLGVVIQRTARTMEIIDVGHIATASSQGAVNSPRDFASDESPELSKMYLRSLTFRNLSFANAAGFDLNVFGENGVKRLRFLYCRDPGTMLGAMCQVLPRWSCLVVLDFVLSNWRTQTHPESLHTFEKLLCSLSKNSLRHLRIEVPALGRLPCVRKIGLHRGLQSLLVGATDLDGRWMTFKPSELRVLVECCIDLRVIGLTFPPLEENADFLVSLRQPNMIKISHRAGQPNRA
jgi:hypothetical protein